MIVILRILIVLWLIIIRLLWNIFLNWWWLNILLYLWWLKNILIIILVSLIWWLIIKLFFLNMLERLLIERKSLRWSLFLWLNFLRGNIFLLIIFVRKLMIKLYKYITIFPLFISYRSWHIYYSDDISFKSRLHSYFRSLSFILLEYL